MIFQLFQNALVKSLTNNLLKQIEPFNVKFHLNERVEIVKKENKNWYVKTNNNKNLLYQVSLLLEELVHLNLENFH